MIEAVVAKWHAYLGDPTGGGLDDLLDDEVVFYSPIVFTPQHGKEVAARYLAAASQTFTGDATEPGHASSAADTGFHYTKTVMAGHTAIMEFETTMQGKYINGVDIIVCNDEGRIIEFRVLIRPLQAVNVVHEQMAAMLGSMPESH